MTSYLNVAALLNASYAIWVLKISQIFSFKIKVKCFCSTFQTITVDQSVVHLRYSKEIKTLEDMTKFKKRNIT